jgi:hypothetical protein
MYWPFMMRATWKKSADPHHGDVQPFDNRCDVPGIANEIARRLASSVKGGYRLIKVRANFLHLCSGTVQVRLDLAEFCSCRGEGAASSCEGFRGNERRKRQVVVSGRLVKFCLFGSVDGDRDAAGPRTASVAGAAAPAACWHFCLVAHSRCLLSRRG